MYIFLNKKKNRIAITIIFIMLCSIFVSSHGDLASLKKDALSALKSISFILAVISALSIVLFNNYVVGIKDKYLLKISEIRNRLEELYDKCSDSENQNLKKLNAEFITPLINLSSAEWLTFDTPNELRSGSQELLEKIHNETPSFLPRHVLRLEDEINELAILYIRRVIVKNYLDMVRSMFTLIVVGMTSIAIIYILPDSTTLNLFSILLSLVIIFWAVMATFHISGFLYNNGKEEGDQLLSDDIF